MRRLPWFASLVLLALLVRALPAQEEPGPARPFTEDEQKVIDKAKRLERELVRLVHEDVHARFAQVGQRRVQVDVVLVVSGRREDAERGA